MGSGHEKRIWIDHIRMKKECAQCSSDEIIEGLRVADASIIPNITSGNTHGPAVMIAEKCADMLLQDAGVRVTLPEGLDSPEPSEAPSPTLTAVAANG